jgi:cobalt-precorrin 5A hydrolase
MKIAIVTINRPSFDSALKLKNYMNEFETDIYISKKTPIDNKLDKCCILYEKLDDILPYAWKSYDAIICILAMGAVVRKIAPHLKDKATDPAVIVINLALDKIVPLLSGHLGGANELANILTHKLPNSINFISTATDQTNTIAFEMIAKRNGWETKNLKALANISNRLLNKQLVKVATYENVYSNLKKDNLKLIDFNEIDENSVIISPFDFKTTNLHLKPKVYLGIGCNRDTSCKAIEEAVYMFLEKFKIKIEQIENIGSFEAKANEIGLLEFAKKYNFKIKFFEKDEINSINIDLSKSQATKFFGLKGVAEPSAILLSNYKELIIKKEVYNKTVTIAGAI